MHKNAIALLTLQPTFSQRPHTLVKNEQKQSHKQTLTSTKIHKCDSLSSLFNPFFLNHHLYQHIHTHIHTQNTKQKQSHKHSDTQRDKNTYEMASHYSSTQFSQSPPISRHIDAQTYTGTQKWTITKATPTQKHIWDCLYSFFTSWRTAKQLFWDDLNKYRH